MLTSPDPSKVAAFLTEGSIPWPAFVRFLGQFTHDIRNGLNAVELQLTLAGELSQDSEVCEEIRRARHSLNDLTKKLQAVRSAAAPVEPNMITYKVADFVEDLRHSLKHRFGDEMTAVTWKTNVDGGTLTGDPDLLPLAIARLFENTFQFREKEAPIELHAATTPEALVLRLIEPREDPSCDPHEWGSQPLQSTRRGGYGLGLFQARQIIAALGGTIEQSYDADARVLATAVTIPRRQPSQ